MLAKNEGLIRGAAEAAAQAGELCGRSRKTCQHVAGLKREDKGKLADKVCFAMTRS